MNDYEQKKLDEGGGEGGKTELGKFQSAALERNRELHMFPTQLQQTGGGGARGGGRKVQKKKSQGTIAEKRKKELMVSDRSWGQWEKHTTGFGSKMLQKVRW